MGGACFSELHKTDKNVLHKDKINSLKYINEWTNNIPKKEEQWEIDMENEEDYKLVYKWFPLKKSKRKKDYYTNIQICHISKLLCSFQ